MAGTWRRTIGFLAILLVALCLIPAGAHLAELPGKMRLSAADYMAVQTIYAGWALWGIAIFAALLVTLAHAILLWRRPAARWLSLGAFLALAATQVIFWAYTFPMNVLTSNWTVPPPSLALAQQQWEYSHAANAVITFVAFVLITLAVVWPGRRSKA